MPRHDAMTRDDREDRLPRWAQDQLDQLRLRVGYAEQSAEEARLATRPAETDTLLYPYADVPIGLPKGERVRFVVDGDHTWIDVRRLRDGTVEVMASSSLVIAPQVTNVLQLHVRR